MKGLETRDGLDKGAGLGKMWTKGNMGAWEMGFGKERFWNVWVWDTRGVEKYEL